MLPGISPSKEMDHIMPDMSLLLCDILTEPLNPRRTAGSTKDNMRDGVRSMPV